MSQSPGEQVSGGPKTTTIIIGNVFIDTATTTTLLLKRPASRVARTVAPIPYFHRGSGHRLVQRRQSNVHRKQP